MVYNLRRVSLNIFKIGDFWNCEALTEAIWDDRLNVVAIASDSVHSRLPDKASSSYLPDGYISMLKLNFIGCFNFVDYRVLFKRQRVLMRVMLSREEVPSYITHRTSGNSLTNIPLPHFSPSQLFLIYKACALCDVKSLLTDFQSFQIQVRFLYKEVGKSTCDYIRLLYPSKQRHFTSSGST